MANQKSEDIPITQVSGYNTYLSISIGEDILHCYQFAGETTPVIMREGEHFKLEQGGSLYKVVSVAHTFIVEPSGFFKHSVLIDAKRAG